MASRTKYMLATIVGIPAIAWFGYETSWQAATALFIFLWMNNLTQT